MEMTKGNLWRQIWIYSVPLMLTNLLQVFFNLADVAVVGKFAGPISLGGVGSTTLLVTLTTGFLIGMSNGVNTLTALFIGSGEKDREVKTVHTGFVLCLVTGLAVLILGIIFANPILSLLGTKDELFSEASIYFKIYMLGSPALAIYNYGNAVLSAAGDTKKPLKYLTTAGVINVLLNLVFVIGLGMQASGVALASILSQYVSAILILRALLKTTETYGLQIGRILVGKKANRNDSAFSLVADHVEEISTEPEVADQTTTTTKPVVTMHTKATTKSVVTVHTKATTKPGVVGQIIATTKLLVDWRIAARILNISIPAAFQYSLFAIANLVVQSAVNSFDHITVEGNSAAMNADAVIYDMMAAFYTACSSFIAQNYGAGNKDRIRKTYLITTFYSFMVGFVLGGLLFVFKTQFLFLFTSDQQVIQQGAIRISVMAFSYCVSALMDNATAGARGLGKTLVPTVAIIFGSVVYRVLWIMTVFAHFHTLQSLYLLYVTAWTFTAIIGNTYFVGLYKKIPLKRADA